MNFVWRRSKVDGSDSEMARAAQQTQNNDLVAKYARALAAAQTDEGTFRNVYDNLAGDKSLRTIELAAIARGYAGAGKAVGSRKAALDVIRKRFVELVRYKAKDELSSKSRPW